MRNYNESCQKKLINSNCFKNYTKIAKLSKIFNKIFPKTENISKKFKNFYDDSKNVKHDTKTTKNSRKISKIFEIVYIFQRYRYRTV